jgi:hypothetical protein
MVLPISDDMRLAVSNILAEDVVVMWAIDNLDPPDAMYCGPVLRHPAGSIQAANFRSAVAF